MELVADSKGISRRRIKETKEAAMKVSPSPNRGASRSRSRSATRSATRSISRQRYTSSDSGATILMKSPSPTMKLPTPRSRSRASSKGKGKRRTASLSRSASSKGKGKRRSSSRTSRSASRQRSASRDPSFTKCADDFVRGKYCADDKPFCNVKTGNCTKIMSKTAPKYTHAGRTAYAPEEDIIKRFESYHKKLTTRGRSRSRSAKRASKSKSRSRSRSASAPRDIKYALKGCQSYDAPNCPTEKPYCGSSGACIKTKPTGGNYIVLNNKKIYGQVATLESLMKSVGAKSPILKEDTRKIANKSPARRSHSRSASRRRSTSRSASKSPKKATPARRRSTSKSPAKKSPLRRNTPIPSGSWAKGCYAPDAPDCDDGTYCGTSGKCIKTKGTYVLELSGKKIYGSMDALTKLASTAGVSESKIKKSSDLKAAAAPVRARSRSRSASAKKSPAKKGSASKGKAPVRARSRSRSASKGKSPAKKSPAKDVSDADIISAFENCIKKK
jgi:hypothetical protein